MREETMWRWIRKPWNYIRAAGLVFHSLIFYLLETKLVDHTNVCDLQFRLMIIPSSQIIHRCSIDTYNQAGICRKIRINYTVQGVYTANNSCMCRNCKGYIYMQYCINQLLTLCYKTYITLVYIYIYCSIFYQMYSHQWICTYA